MVRDDLADVALADRVFAPHYVRGLAQTLKVAADIHKCPSSDSENLGALAAASQIEVFDINGGWAWVRSRLGPGYIRADAIALK